MFWVVWIGKDLAFVPHASDAVLLKFRSLARRQPE